MDGEETGKLGKEFVFIGFVKEGSASLLHSSHLPSKSRTGARKYICVLRPLCLVLTCLSSSLVEYYIRTLQQGMIEPFDSARMAACEVSQIVASIVSAYNSGLDVFKRMKRRKKSSSKDTKPAQEDAILQASLEHRPKDIRTEYEKSVAKLGHRFEIGDTIAHSSLAHTLLVLNSGLISVLNNWLSDDGVKRRQSQRSLLSISETAAADALFALGQLNHRLAAQPRLPATLSMPTEEPRLKKSSHSRQASKTVVDIKIDPKVKSRAENNLLARGGWVRAFPAARSKSGSSIVTLTSSRNASTTKLTDHKRHKSSTSGTASPPGRSASRSPKGSPRPGHKRAESSPAILTQLSQYTAGLPVDMMSQQRHRSPENRRIAREPSMLIVPSDFFESFIELPPPQQPKVPLHSRPSMNIRSTTGIRPRPPSVATFMTASTKIGEIPEHRWPAQASGEQRPLPYVIPPPLNVEDVSRKKKGRGFRFWKKAEPEPSLHAVVY
jgi:hypothetical protein